MAARDAPKPQIDRQSTTPFHLKLFYRVNNFHPLSDFAPPSPPSHNYSGPLSGPNSIRSRSPPPPQSSTAHLPAHLEIYTWQSCTLRELSQLLTSALPSLLPDPAVGTRLCFRLIYPDTKAAATMGPDARGRYLSKDMGSVVVGPRESPYREEEEESQHQRDADGGEGTRKKSTTTGAAALRLQGHEADKTLQEMRFVIGDYVDCAVLPPLEDGSVAPPLTVGRGAMSSTVGGGMRAFREPGFGRSGGGRGGRGGAGGGDRGMMPMGDWKRGERLPEGGGGGRGGGRRGWAPY